jgi:hypothetical protein
VEKQMSTKPILSTDSEERKNTPIYAGCVQYFPLALAAVARHSKRGNDKHNPGQPLHWDRTKSMDHLECIQRHLVDEGHYNEELDEYEEACAIAWRALANLQLREEQRLADKQAPVQVPTARRKIYTGNSLTLLKHLLNGGYAQAVVTGCLYRLKSTDSRPQLQGDNGEWFDGTDTWQGYATVQFYIYK